MVEDCPSCGDLYECVGQHISLSDCKYPELTEYQMDVSIGILMSDGNITCPGKEPRLRVINTNKEYLEYVDDVFGWYSNGVHLSRTSDQVKQDSIQRGYGSKDTEFKDQYMFRTRNSPEFRDLLEWYNSGKKVWPRDIQLTKDTLKHLYCGDGTYHNRNSEYISIACSNEHKNKEKVNSLFERVGFEKPRWTVYPQEVSDGCVCHITFSKSESEKMWEYMGSPPPGFEYKWPERFK